jgi:hypothetical protein
VTGSCKILHVERTADALVDDVYLSPITYDDGLYRALEVGTDVLNSISGAVGTITLVSTLENASDNVTNKNDDNAQNSQFESEGNSWVDFSESNPFGEIQLP